MDTIGALRIFENREEAGRILAEGLTSYKNVNALVLGIPRGGVAVAAEVARVLAAELSVVITKKLSHPRNEELAFGALAEDGSKFLLSSAKEIDKKSIAIIANAQRAEIDSRVRRFRSGRPLPNMAGRVVIIVDDGIATGSTLVPAVMLCRSRKASKIVVAAPVAGKEFVEDLSLLADDVIIAERPEAFYAVGQVYRDFHALADEEVQYLLFQNRRRAQSNFGDS